MPKITFKREWLTQLGIHKKYLALIGIAILTLFFAALSLYFFSKYRSERAQNPNYEVEQLEAAISKLMELPEGAVTLATVTDEEKLHEQGLFSGAKNGDKILVYQDAGKAIVYRPSTNKIIAVERVNAQANQLDEAPLSSEESAVPVESETATTPLKLIILNGTTTPGLTNTAQKRIEAESSNFEILSRDNARSKNYDQSLLIQLKGELTPEVNSLAEVFGAEITDLPEGEEVGSDADLVLILGQDYTLASSSAHIE